MADQPTYPDTDPEILGDHYTRHLDAMTTEGLHEKSAIAAQLALRDLEIDRLRALASQAQAPTAVQPPASLLNAEQFHDLILQHEDAQERGEGLHFTRISIVQAYEAALKMAHQENKHG